MEALNTTYQLPKDAVWLITGCSSGIGRSLASHILQASPSQRVVATARNPTSLDDLAGSEDSHRLLRVALDVTSPASVSAAFDAALGAYGRVDVVVNNAGFGLMGDAEGTGENDGDGGGMEQVRGLMETNFWGVARVMRKAVGVFRDVNRKTGKIGGVIMNVTSMGGRMASPGNAFYHASKWAVEGYAEALGKEMLPEWNVHVCNIEPGGVSTDYAGRSMNLPPRNPAYMPPLAASPSPTTAMIGYVGAPELTATFAQPDRIAAAMYAVVGSGIFAEEGDSSANGSGSGNKAEGEGVKIPLRVPLGPDAWGYLAEDAERTLAQLRKLREFSCAAGKEGQMENLRERLYTKKEQKTRRRCEQ